MRPHKLTMSAFGPYSGEEVLEMNKLDGCGIYLITGDTGAGKTTIFDAITYALYGEASGDNRKPEMLRSRYAEPSAKTFVELEFEHRGRKYRVRRNPAYERPKLRGEGTAKEIADASIEYLLPDGECEKVIAGKISEVNSAVEEIIGLDRNQFSQVAMVAQGAFLNLLYAGTAEREKIFRQIFRTGRWEKLQQRLKEEEKTAADSCSENLKKMHLLFGNIDAEEGSTYFDKLEEYKLAGPASFIFDEEKSELVSEIIENDILLKKQLSEESKNIGELIKKEEIIAETAKNFAGLIEKAEAQAEEALKADGEKEAAERALTLTEGKKTQAEEAMKNAALIRSELDKYEAYEELKGKISEAERKAGEAESAAKKAKKAEQETREKIEKCRKRISEAGNCEAELIKKEAELEKIIEKMSRAEEALETCTRYFEKYEEAESSVEAYVLAKKDYIEKSSKYEEERKVFLDNQAGILASALEEGQKCPVCGSIHHPEPAVLPGKTASKEALDKMKKALDKAAAVQEKASIKANRAEAEAAQTFNSVIKLGADLGFKTGERAGDKEESYKAAEAFYSHIEESAAGLEERLEAVKAESEGLATIVEAKNKAVDELDKLESALPELEKASAESAEATIQTKAEVSGLNNLIKTAAEGLRFGSRAEAEAEAEKLEKLKADIESEIDLRRKEAENKRKIAAEKKAAAETYRTQAEEGRNRVGGEPAEILAKIGETLSGLNAKSGELKEVEEKTSVRLVKNREAFESLNKLLPVLKESEKRLMMIRSLSDTAGGKITERDKVSLETYIQMEYFDRIVGRANIRLLEMTGGQYELRRRAFAAGKRRNEGLELDVVDHYNNTVRDVRTLSGGEGFKAALSLALGTSDEIQESSGGVKLDTMFIDEGFGSLDEESVNQALNALAALSHNDRLVGIISHVETLKQRIDSQILVRKSQTGSSAEIRV